ncbi:hypothetical protein NB311A_07168 [Nitrobacter sp. Nb-311A]|uniref:hypothetical protein n=1 Tax=unclassified Nitrobacter TaxID=2620411 RepID=UPI0000684BEF|nr:MULTISPECIES: hypothetical protein [unclassified Nitrobacter]EAQ36910.1 hypothetical protein NB311A_07168 [Nitrobacter sp. Nb-311A]MCV0386843.1 hypothetical protein [Nitrobacter sp.]
MNRIVHDNVVSVQFRPDAHHRSVQTVLKDPKLSSDEKRAILSAWASDMYAVESSPMLRMIPGHTTPLRLSEILSALRGLDDDDPPPRGGTAKRISAGNMDTDGHADVASAAYRLARLRREADLRAASMRAHRDNIRRYKRILKTDLTDLERQFVVRRLVEEQSAIRKLAQAQTLGGAADADFSFAASC